MSGQNPCAAQPNAARPRRKFTVTYHPMGVTVDVDPEALPCGPHGRAGSLLDIALANGVKIDHACGGVGACSTCHVVVREGFHSLSEPTDAEEDMLDNAPGVTCTSRLACQAVPDGRCNLVVEIPSWNRNLVSE
jgi:2Fe-2S ferredoxin